MDDNSTAKPAPNASTISSPVSTTVEEQDVAVFGDSNEALADALAGFIKKAIESGVKSLPLLKDADRSRALIETIQKPYMKHIDLMEVYGKRNIFTLRHFPPRRRQNIVERFQSGNKGGDDGKYVSETSPSKDASTMPAPVTKYPTKDEVPSKDALENIQAELAQLSTQLKKATERRNSLVEQGVFLAAAQSSTAKAVQSVKQADLLPNEDQADVVQGPATAAVMGGQGLQELNEEGKRLQADLEERKRRKQENDNDNDAWGGPESLPSTRKKRVLTMEEAYQHDRQQISVALENVSAVSNFLKKSRPAKT